LFTVSVFPSAIVNTALVAGAVTVTLLRLVAVATPNVGVTKVGLVANTNPPVPVSSVTADRRFALEGVERNVAIPEPRPETPDEIGKLVQLVNVPEIGVPNAGADNDTLVKKLAIEICFVTPL
jgi:hypothetical protein